MASPQKENGFTPIANELLDALCRTQVNSEARRLFDYILRKTYGFNKKSDVIAASQFIKGTGLPRRSVERGRRVLRKLNMITTDKIDGSQKLKISIQKDYARWSGYVPFQETTDKIDGEPPTELTHTTDKIDGETTDRIAVHKRQKDNIQKKDLKKGLAGSALAGSKSQPSPASLKAKRSLSEISNGTLLELKNSLGEGGLKDYLRKKRYPEKEIRNLTFSEFSHTIKKA
jgi:phage replication O-like protein O